MCKSSVYLEYTGQEVCLVAFPILDDWSRPLMLFFKGCDQYFDIFGKNQRL